MLCGNLSRTVYIKAMVTKGRQGQSHNMGTLGYQVPLDQGCAVFCEQAGQKKDKNQQFWLLGLVVMNGEDSEQPHLEKGLLQCSMLKLL